MQAALNGAVADLPGDLPTCRLSAKPIPTAPHHDPGDDVRHAAPSAIYDIADTVVAQRLSQVDGVAEINVSGAEQPAIRVRVNPIAIATMGVSMEDVRHAIVNANAAGPLGEFDADGLARSLPLMTRCAIPPSTAISW